uniref:Uncharacterized protein n=1 Tax=Arundo donax TaxID=35708 RepID=A0A0A9B7I2_ARUDO
MDGLPGADFLLNSISNFDAYGQEYTNLSRNLSEARGLQFFGLPHPISS